MALPIEGVVPMTVLVLTVLFWPIFSFLSTYRRLSHIPGPFLARFTNLWMIQTSYSGRLTDIFIETDQKYGSLVRVGPNQVLSSDIDLLRQTGAVRGTYDRDEWYSAFKFVPTMANLFNITSREEHDRRKGKISVAYNISGREVDLTEPNVDEQVRRLVGLIRRKYATPPPPPPAAAAAAAGGGGESNKETGSGSSSSSFLLPPLLDFAKVSAYFTLDVASRAAFGTEFGHLQTDDDVTGWMEHLHSSWPLVSLVNESYWARKMFYSDWFLSMFGSQVTDAAGIGKVRSFVVDIVSERFRKHEAGDDVEETKKDMLSSWMKHGLTQTQCDAESLLALVAGSETSASVIRMTLLCLLTNPAAYRRLQETVRETLKRGDVSEPISFAQAKAIPYVKAVVYEGMRMRPGTQGTFPKIVPPQGETVQGGVFLPGGTRVGMNVPAVLRNEQVFGAHPAAFRPERWLDPQLTPAKVAEMEQATELVFGTGRWMCAGKPIALMELYKVFFELARNFEFGIANPIQPMETTCYNVYVDRNFWVWATDVAAKA